MGGVARAFQGTYDTLIKGQVPQAPELPPPPAAPTGDDPAAQKAQEEAAAAERRQRGRASTLLTGAAGITTEAPTSKRMLLGS